MKFETCFTNERILISIINESRSNPSGFSNDGFGSIAVVFLFAGPLQRIVKIYDLPGREDCIIFAFILIFSNILYGVAFYL